MVEVKERLENGIDVLSISNSHLTVEVTNFGCTLLKIVTKDKNNQDCDCILGFEHVEDYQKRDGTYLNALVGRVCNRIEKGTFTINGTEYHVPINNGPNSLHGGIEGFSYKVFDYTLIEDGVKFHYVSKDGEEGYPGTLDFYAIYWLDESSLHIQYSGVSDKDTLINITNHGYFNLNGYASNIDDHTLRILASKFGCVDPDGLYTGELKDVKETAFDFNTEKRIGDFIHSEDEQLIIARGYDHPYVFDTKENQVCLYSPLSGIELKVSTTYPTAQIYSANYLDGQTDKYGKIMHPQDGICIETSYIADSIHKEENPKVLLKAGQVFEEETTYTFEVRK